MFRHLHVRSWFNASRKEAGSFRSLNVIVSSLAAILLLMPTLLFSYGTAQAANGDPTLSIPTGPINVMGDSTFLLPISFADAAAPNEISALSFSLDFDQTCLTFDSVTDTNADGIPNAVTNLPVGYMSTVSYDALDTDGEIDLSIRDQTDEQNALPDALLVTFEFGVRSECRALDNDQTDGNLAIKSFTFDTAPAPTFGNLTGQAVTGGTHVQGNRTLRFNATPTAIGFIDTNIDENSALGTTVGTLTTTDFDISQTPNDSHTYSLIAGDGTNDADNSSFAIVGAALTSNTALNFETKLSYAVRVRTTDSYGGTFDQSFQINVVDVNETPTGLSIGNSGVAENAGANAVVGGFTSLDQDPANTATYSLVAGVGDTDNGLFNISATNLQANASFNYETQNSYNIRVRVTDNGTGALWSENIFTIRVIDANEAPMAVADLIDADVQVFSVATDIFVLANDTDEDRVPTPDTLTVVPGTITAPSSGGAVANSGNLSIRYTPVVGFNGPVDFNYTTYDGFVNSAAPANVSLQVVADDDRGDCNADGNVNAGDFPAFVLELADLGNENNDTINWYDVYTGDFDGSPRGCDANASKSVTISDLTCAVLVSFNNSVCTTSTPVQAASTLADAELAVGQNLIGVPNSTVNVPVQLNTNGQNVAAASFALSFDKGQLTFDATDADQNGLPDAVTFNTPQGMVTVANYNEAAGRLELTVYAVTVPMPTLADGLVANVTLQVNEDATLAATPVTLLQSSLGSDQGQAVPVAVSDGSVQIAQARLFFLPLISR